MTARPRIAADVAAALTAAIPPRLIKKLDAEPTLADKWTWSPSSIVTDKGETVTLTLTGEVITGVACSCLLQPKCLHIAAVVTLLEPDASTSAVAPAAREAAAPREAIVVDLDAAKGAFAALGAVLAGGAESSGAFAQAELLRSIHACRTAGLHRLATAQTRALRSIRELRSDRPEFSLPILTADLRDGLAVAHALAHATEPATTALVGTARREYEDVGNMRLRGVLTEAIVARSGYAGATTYLIDDRGTLYTRSDVAPGDAGRAAGAYDGSAAIGDAVLPHRELCRSGLFVSDATASADGRLGAGQQVRAVRSSEPSRWDGDHLAAKFARALADQLAQIAALDAAPDELRPAGWDFLYVDGTLLGGPGGVGIVARDERSTPLRFTTVHDHRVLPTRDNFVVLSRASGLSVRAIGRCRIGVPRELELLAIGPAPGEARFTMPDAWHGRANVHYDRLSLMSITDAPNVTVGAALPNDDLLGPLRRRVERAVLGGANTLPTHAIAELEREATALAERSLRGGADVLRDLAALAHDASRAATGMRRPLDRTAFASAWLRAALYEDSARRRLSVASW